MKKFLTSKFFSKSNRNPNEVNESINTIEKELETLSHEIKELEKQIRIETKVSEELEKQLTEEIDKNDAIDKEIEEMGKQEKILIQEIKTQEKDIQSLEQTESDLRQMIETMDRDMKRQSEEYENQKRETISMKEHFEKELELKRQAYHSLNQIMLSDDSDSDFRQLELKKNEFKALQIEVNSLQTQLKEMKEKKNKFEDSDIPQEVIDWFADPYRVIIEMAKIKVESNQLQKIIDTELIRRQNMRTNDSQSNESNNQISQISEESKTNTEVIESDPSVNETHVTNVNIFEIVANQPNTSSAAFGLFERQSPDSNIFGATKSEKSQDWNTGQQSCGFSLFDNQTATTSAPNQSTFSLFNSSPKDANNESGFELNNLFGNTSGPSSPNKSEESFNVFK